MGIRNNYTKDERKEKIPYLVALPFPVYEVEAHCFPVSENTENKLAVFNLTDLMTISERWIINAISVGNTKRCSNVPVRVAIEQ